MAKKEDQNRNQKSESHRKQVNETTYTVPI
jgi:hypothetical protein